MSKTKVLLDSGFGNVLSYVSAHTSTAPVIDNAVEGKKVDAAVSVAQTSGSVVEMLGKQLPTISIGGKIYPIGGVGLSGIGLMNDIINMRTQYNKDGSIPTSSVYSALSNISTAASALTLAKAAGVAAVGGAAAPLLGVAAALTVAGAALTIASVAADSSIDLSGMMDSLRESFQSFSELFGSAYNEAVESMLDKLSKDAGEGDEGEAIPGAGDIPLPGEDDPNAPSKSANPERGAEGGVPGKAGEGVGNAENTSSPLIFDLDGDGVETSDNGVFFDHDGNGFAEFSGWVGKDDGLLVLDKNANGQIDDGNELFGNNSVTDTGKNATNGFTALAEYDHNDDGVIDSQDAVFETLQVWRDVNGDGVTDSGELLSLGEAGVKSINLAYSNIKNTDEQGNQHLQQGGYTRTDGSVANVVDVWFKVNFVRTLDKNEVEVSEAIAQLPDVVGAGNMSDLRQAMARSTDGNLQQLVEQFVQMDDREGRYKLADEILRVWSGANNYATDSRGRYIDGQKLYALEAFVGKAFSQYGNPNPMSNAAEKLESTYKLVLDSVYGQLMLQSHLSDVMDNLKVGVENQRIVWDVSELISALRTDYSEEPQKAIDTLAELGRSLKGVDSEYSLAVLDALQGNGNRAGDDIDVVLNALAEQLELNIGGYADDTLSATDNTARALYGLSGNDKLYGAKGGDSLHGGKGGDYLNGGDGNDRYHYARGDGHDTIEEKDAWSGKDDRLLLENINADRVSLTRDGNDVILHIAASAADAGDDGSVRLKAQYDAYYERGVENVAFADGTIWTAQTLRELAIASMQTAGDDRVIGSNVADALRGGTGDDYLNGGDGNDRYHYARGDGHDTIEEKGAWSGKDDRLLLEDINADRVSLTRDGNDVILHIAASAADAGDGGSVRLKAQYDAYYERGVENVAFADGAIWTAQTLRELAIASMQTAGDDRVIGSNVADGLRGGAGDDYLNGGDGNDRYHYARGDGHDTIEEKGAWSGKDDRLLLEDINADRVSLTRDGNDVILHIAASAADAGDDGSVRLKAQYDAYYERGVENVAFADGAIWTAQTLRELAIASMQTAGDDRVIGSNVADGLRGGAGDDYLNGGDGNDRYYYARGDGHDTIEEKGGWSGKNDRLVLDGINADQVNLTRDGNDVILHIAESAEGADDGGSVRLKAQYDANYERGVENVAFADGAIWTAQTLRELAIASMQTAGDDRVIGSNVADTLRGGAGDDYLNGGDGNDRYHYARGDGDDTIEEGTWEGKDDRLSLDGINADQVSLTRDGNDVILHIAASAADAGDGGSVRLKAQYDAYYERGVENVAFADGTIWTAQTLRELAIASMQTAGDDRVIGSNVADGLRGGAGDDYLNGGDGNDRYHYARGDGHDTIEEGTWEGKDDRLSLDGINADQVSLTRDGNDVILHIAASAADAGDGGSVRLKAQYDAYYERGVENVAFADGTIWTAQTLRELAIASMQTAGDDRVIGSNVADGLRGGAGDDYLNGGDGNDRYHYARGDGHDTIEEKGAWSGKDDRLLLE
ncbi:calcium-binding protein, partial [Brenneria sp. g21c3]|uniref:calcium-binding protein n=1 Tax=Brenneria sp. g21c3 TaxID=3093893 RepID=UPI002EB23D2B|nr:calcium-binding protein [Brenneria sp. g21c3]